MSLRLDWARANKPALVKFQHDTGIPAIWAAAQMLHEAFNSDGTLSQLAARYNNFAGVKWARNGWQSAYGGRPVNLATFEFVEGERQDVSDAFCALPSWENFLRMYGDLLTGSYYGPLCLPYAADPLLFGRQVAQAGYATDPKYVDRVAGWMREIWPIYADTLPGQPPVTVTIVLEDTGEAIQGELRGSTTWGPIRRTVECVGGHVEWVQNGPKVIVKKGGHYCDSND